MSGHEDALLSELCTICHERPPKYRCPRCSTRTCSLPCTRRHKLWSQCSGIRNPAEYVKRTELSTPSGFDRDFNFITGIERVIERADKEVENRAIPLDRESGTAENRRRHDKIRGECSFQRAVANSGVHVAKAPKGMTRSKQNSSHWERKKKCLVWTVEWVSPDGQKVKMSSAENCSISTAYPRAVPPTQNKKRKLNFPDSNQHPVPGSTSRKAQRGQGKSKPEPTSPTDTSPASGDAIPIPPGTSLPPGNTSVKQQIDVPTETKDDPVPEPYFYLHRPQTRSKLPVLIPISPDATLADVLRGRVVLEFPTIYVLTETPELVPRGKYMLEAEYVERENEGLEVLDETPEGTAERLSEEGEITERGSVGGVGQLDEKKVFEVLKKDLEARVGSV